MYKISAYNIVEKNDNNDLLIMNMRTERHIKIASELANEFSSLFEQTKFDCNPEDWRYKALIDGGFIIAENFNEARWVELKHNEVVFGSETFSVTLMPTNDCNFRCVYCYQTPDPKYMSEEVEKKVLRFFERKVPHSKKVRVSWFGGEPLLDREQTCRMANEIDKICKKNQVPLIGVMNTNGYNLDVNTFKRLIASRLLSYEICIDGPQEMHNQTRPHMHDKDSFKMILDNLIKIKDQVSSNIFQITIRCNVTPAMNEHFETYLKILAEYFRNDTRFHVYFQGVRDWGGDRIEEKSIPKNENEIYKVWYDEAAKMNLTSAESFPLEPFVGYCEGNRKNGYIVNCDGTLHKCTIAMYNKEHEDVDSIGYIDDFGRDIVDENKLANWIVRQKPIPDSCRVCEMYPMCVNGSCFYQLNIRQEARCNKLQEVAKAQLRCMDYKNMLMEIEEKSYD